MEHVAEQRRDESPTEQRQIDRATRGAKKAAKKFQDRHGRAPTRAELRRETIQTASPILRSVVALLGLAVAALGGGLALWASDAWEAIVFGIVCLGFGSWLVVLGAVGRKEALEEVACQIGEEVLRGIVEAVFSSIS